MLVCMMWSISLQEMAVSDICQIYASEMTPLASLAHSHFGKSLLDRKNNNTLIKTLQCIHFCIYKTLENKIQN